jgi:hypothetical protein
MFSAMQVILIEAILVALRDYRRSVGLNPEDVGFDDVASAVCHFFTFGNKVNAIRALRELSCQHPLIARISYPEHMSVWAEDKLRAAVKSNGRSTVIGLKEAKDLIDFAEANWTK